MADLTTTVTESVVLNGALRGNTNSVTTTGINSVFERILTCPQAATTTIATFSDNVYDSAGAIDTQGVKYIRVTNLDDTYDMELGVAGVASNYAILLPAGTSHIITRAEDVMLAEADAVPTYGSLADITKLEARPTSANDISVSIFVGVE
jgi:hypothetical protein